MCRTSCSGREYCLKIAPDTGDYGEVDFESDAYSYASLGRHGLPAPQVQGLGAVNGAVYLVLDWIEPATSQPDAFTRGARVGSLLHEVHAISVSGVGAVRRGGWEASQLGPFVEDNVEQFFRRRILEAPEMRGLAPAVLRALDELVARCHDRGIAPVLLHGDLGLDNVIFRDEGAPILIDPGWSIGGDALLDVSYFLTLERDERVVAGFLRGYSGFETLDRARLKSWTVYHHVAKLLHRIESGRPAGIETWKRWLGELLAAT